MNILTIDESRGVYIIEGKGKREERCYRSLKVAKVVGEFYRRKLGWQVRRVAKKVGTYPKNEEMVQVWRRTLDMIDRGVVLDSRQLRTVELFLDCGLVANRDDFHFLTKRGRDWLDKPMMRVFERGQVVALETFDGVVEQGQTSTNGNGAHVAREMIERVKALKAELKAIEAEFKTANVGIPAEVSVGDIPIYLKIKRGERTFDEAAKEAGVSATTLKRTEAGEVVSHVDTVLILCRWLGIKKILVGDGDEGA